MVTECSESRLEFQPLARRKVAAAFDGGRITSDAGGLLLREVEERTGILRQFAACFTDHRSPGLIEHAAEELISQRVYGVALGYEDLNDHDELRYDPLLAALVGKRDLTGQNRRTAEDRGKPLAGKSTLNRLELTLPNANRQTRYKKIVADEAKIEALFVEFFLQAHARPPRAGRAGFGRHGRPAVRQAGGPLLSRLLQRVLLPAAEYLSKGENPRFVVTSFSAETFDARTLYEVQYCARGEMENRIKEQQLYLFADRTSTSQLRSNQLRLWFSAVAYVLLHALRRIGLVGTPLARATCQTIRLKLLKIGAVIRVTVRRLWVSFSSSYPFQQLFAEVLANVRAIPPPQPSG